MSKRMELKLLGLAWLVFASIMLYLLSLDVLSEVQLVWTATAVLLMFVLRRSVIKQTMSSFDAYRFTRLMIMLLGGMIALRYVWWRTFHSLPLDADWGSMVGGILLYLAEMQAVLTFFLGTIVYLSPRERKRLLISIDQENLPTVDVMVPTYNESIALLRVTLLACRNLRYPADKLSIYLLDDGGTEARRHADDPVLAKQSHERHLAFKALCKEVGVHYLTRANNEHAKAGNINAALKQTDGDLVMILDCDHVPTVDFLENTVAYFQKDEKLWLVQTPHYMINKDPIEKNMGKPRDMPSESELFYTQTMRCLDNWNAAFFCGSGALLRRSCLEITKGICTETVTEDIETSVELHRRGYNSVYLHKPLLAGLQPESFVGFVIQRTRWAHGMLQVFMLKNPLLVRGLTLGQRVSYLNMTSYWFFAVMRMVFLLAPAVYLIFGVRLYDAPVDEILLYTVPYILSFVLYFNVFFGRWRWFLVSEVYETLQTMFAFKTVFTVVLHPQRGHFMVTPKDENFSEDFVSPVAWVFYVFLAILGLAVVNGLGRLWEANMNTFGIDLLVTFWSVLNFLVLLAAVGALFERKQVRATSRFDVDIKAVVLSEEHQLAARMVDLSSTGARLYLHHVDVDRLTESIVIRVYCEALQKDLELCAKVYSYRRSQEDSSLHILGIGFTPQSIEEERQVIALSYGDSERWRQDLIRRNQRSGFVEGISFFFKTCLPRGFFGVVMQIKFFLLRPLQGLKVSGKEKKS